MSHPIEAYLGLVSAAPAGFSSDGSTVLVVSNATGMRQLYTVPVEGGALRQVSQFAEPLSSARYIPGGHTVLVSLDVGGNERLQIHRINDDGTGFGPVVQDPAFIHRLGGISRDGRLIAYACNRRNGVAFDIFVRDLATGEERCAWQRGGMCSAAGFSPDGSRVAVIVHSDDRAFDSNLYLVDVASGEAVHVNPHDGEAQVTGPSWLPDGSGFWFAQDQDREFLAPCRYDTGTSTWSVRLETNWDTVCDIDASGRRLLLRRNEDGYDLLEIRDPWTFELLGEVPLPGKGVVVLQDAVSSFGPAFSPDGRYIAFPFVAASEPGDTWLFDTETDALRRLTEMPRAVPAAEMVEPELHRFTSFDGLIVPAFVYRPAETGAQPPVVVLVHGGPESQYLPTFNPVVQYLVSMGYAVVAPNVRGSAGYGKRYVHLDDVEKRLDSVRDLAALHAWLPSVGLDGHRAALMGQSYGGYMVLAGLAFQPDLWAAGVDLYGIANMVSLLENTAPWRRKFREVEYGSLERDRDLLREISPITHIERVRAPLFVIHGANDPRVPISETYQVRDALLARGLRCEMVVYGDEGHGLTRLKNRVDAYPKVAAFLGEVLRG